MLPLFFYLLNTTSYILNSNAHIPVSDRWSRTPPSHSQTAVALESTHRDSSAVHQRPPAHRSQQAAHSHKLKCH